jgi:2-oxoisovalerate dehydrogenase E1 component
LEANNEEIKNGNAVCIITYGMGVHWSLKASKSLEGKVTILDLRTLVPLDEELIYETVRRHGRCLVVTEETLSNTFAQSVAARIQENCWTSLDAPVRTIGSVDMPAVPLNEVLEKEMILSAEKVFNSLQALLEY